MDDTFRTITNISEAIYTEKRSKFIAYALPVSSVDEIKDILAKYRKTYYDARHVCWAYMLGAKRVDFRSNDDGEPSGTAGKPILGQINSKELTDILVVVIRYFGGVKLGTGGLITAYKAAAAAVLEVSDIVVKTVMDKVSIRFEYTLMNSVMRVVKETEAEIVDQSFDTDCNMTLAIRSAKFNELFNRLQDIDGVSLSD